MALPDRTRYVCIWPITDLELPRSALEAEASHELSYTLGRLGLRATGRPEFTVTEDWRLFAVVPVARVGDDSDVDETAVRALIQAGETDGHIAARLGCPRSEVERIRGEVGQPAGEPAAAGVVA